MSPRCGCSCAARPGWPSSPSRPGPSPIRSCCGSTRPRACGCSCRRWPDSPGAHRSPGHLVRPRAGRTAGALRAPAARRAHRRPPVLRPAKQRRGDLAHRAAAARLPARRPSLPAQVMGTRGRGHPGPRSSALAGAVAARVTAGRRRHRSAYPAGRYRLPRARSRRFPGPRRARRPASRSRWPARPG